MLSRHPFSEGLLFREFDQIFSDVFGKRATAYRDIVGSLVQSYPEEAVPDLPGEVIDHQPDPVYTHLSGDQSEEERCCT